MYFYVAIGNDEEPREILNLQRRPRPEEIKHVDGKPALRPLIVEDMPAHEMADIYELKEQELIVEPTRVVRRFKSILRENYKQLLKDRLQTAAHSARGKLLSTYELSGTGLQVKMMMDEEAEEFLKAPQEDREPLSKFPFISAGLGTISTDPVAVAKHYRDSFMALKEMIAGIERERLRVSKLIDDAATPDAAVRAFDKRGEALRV